MKREGREDTILFTEEDLSSLGMQQHESVSACLKAIRPAQTGRRALEKEHNRLRQTVKVLVTLEAFRVDDGSKIMLFLKLS